MVAFLNLLSFKLSEASTIHVPLQQLLTIDIISRSCYCRCYCHAVTQKIMHTFTQTKVLQKLCPINFYGHTVLEVLYDKQIIFQLMSKWLLNSKKFLIDYFRLQPIPMRPQRTRSPGCVCIAFYLHTSDGTYRATRKVNYRLVLTCVMKTRSFCQCIVW